MAMTSEQMCVVLHDGGHAVVGAVAGSGKSTTLVHRIVHLLKHGVAPDDILVMMFNKTAQQDFKRRLFRQLKKKALVDSLKVKTFHAFGKELLDKFVEEQLLPPAKLLTFEWEVANLAREALAYANGMVNEEERVDIDNEVVGELLTLIDLAKSNLYEAEDLRLEVPSKVYRDAFRAFEDLRKERELRTFADLIFDPTNLLVSGTGQVREKALRIASNRFKHIILDEYQDINEGQQALVKVVAGKTAKVMAVGDEDQCLIAGTQIAMADGSFCPIEKVKVGDLVVSNYGSGAFRAARVTRVFDKPFEGSAVKVTTASGKQLVSTPEHTHFAGYLDGVSPQTHFVYLMFKKGYGYRIGVCKVYSKLRKVKPVMGFRERARQERADALWILDAIDSPNEARIREIVLSLKYQIPTVPFVARKGCSTNGFVHDQAYLRRIFGSFDTEASAGRLFKDFGLDVDRPHFRPRGRNASRRTIVVTLCANSRPTGSPQHGIAVVGSDREGRAALAAAGFSVRTAKKGSASWRVETSLANYGDLLSLVSKLCDVLPDAHVHQVARLGGEKMNIKDRNSLPFTRAEAMRPGMIMFDGSGGYDVVVRVESVAISTVVYDLNIERTHNFVANGLVTHNCIYAWRGAKPEYMTERFEDDFPGATRFKLSRTFRFGHCISLAADHLITHNTQRTDKLCISGGQYTPWTQIWTRTYMTQKESSGAQVMDAVNDWMTKGRKASELAILVREYSHSLPVEVALMTTGTAYKLEGAEPALDRRELKAMRGYLLLAVKGFGGLEEKERKEVFEAMLVTPTLYLKGEVREGLVASMAENFARPEYVLMRAADKAGRAGGQTLREAADHWATITKFGPDAKACELLEEIRALLDLDKYFEKQHAHPDTQREKKMMIDEYLRFAQQLDLSVVDFCTRIRELMQNVKDGGEDVVLVTSVHRSKGLEWPHVILTELADGKFPAFSGKNPSPEVLEEERRLFYVAMTRAKEKLTLVAPWDRNLTASMKEKKGVTPDHVQMYASRFLYEANLTLAREMGIALHKNESPRTGYAALPTQIAERYLKDVEAERSAPKEPALDKSGRRMPQISADAPFTPSLF